MKKWNSEETSNKQRWRVSDLLSLIIGHFDLDKGEGRIERLRERSLRTFAQKMAESTNKKLTKDQIAMCEQIDQLAEKFIQEFE